MNTKLEYIARDKCSSLFFRDRQKVSQHRHQWSILINAFHHLSLASISNIVSKAGAYPSPGAFVIKLFTAVSYEFL